MEPRHKNLLFLLFPFRKTLEENEDESIIRERETFYSRIGSKWKGICDTEQGMQLKGKGGGG